MESFSISQYQFLGVLGIITLPPIYVYFKTITKNSFLWGILFIIAFTSGSMEFFGIHSSISKFSRELIIILLAILTFTSKGRKIRLPGFKYVLLFIIISFSSSLINGESLLLLFLFLRKYLIIIIFFYTILNYPFKSNSYKYLDKLIIGLVLAQIVFSLIKYSLIGITEPIIGTMSVLGGGFTTIFGLTGVCLSTAFYLLKKERKYIVIAFLFIIFSLIGGKRAMFIYTPLIFLSVLYFYQKFERIKGFYFVKNLFFILIISSISIFAVVKLNPTLNPENTVGGTFDLNYLSKYSDWYLNDYEQDGVNQSRGKAPYKVIEVLSQDSNLNMLFGLGSGHLIENSLNSELSQYDSHLDFLLAKYNLGYGVQTGVLMLLLQTGILGVLSYLSIFISLYRKSYFKVKSKFKYIEDNTQKSILLGSVSLFIVFFVIFVSYTSIIIDNYAPNILIFWIISIPFRNYSTQNQL